MNALALTIVLVHGGFVDASGWQAVHDQLRQEGYSVSLVQNPTTSLAADVAYTKRVIDAAPGPVLLVGHSYGGVVVTEAGNSDKVKGLVYLAAFAPDKGESVQSLTKVPVPGAEVPPLLPARDGFILLDSKKFPAAFAGDVEPKTANFMANSQVPWGVEALAGTISEASWKKKPSYYLVAKDDKMIPPQAQRGMSQRIGATVEELNGSHAFYVSRPTEVTSFIKKAAQGVAAKAN
ncbi:MAG: alpha/beta hydrolase [Pseudomonadota bacterium]